VTIFEESLDTALDARAKGTFVHQDLGMGTGEHIAG